MPRHLFESRFDFRYIDFRYKNGAPISSSPKKPRRMSRFEMENDG